MKPDGKALLIRQCRLHAVTDQAILESPEFEARARFLAGTGKVALALRGHKMTGREFYDKAMLLREITREAGVPLIINTRLDVALAVEADFVHLGHHSLPLEAAVPLCCRYNLPFGYSCHDLAQVERALAHGAAYVYLGTIFPTGAKPGIKAAGVGLVEDISARVSDVPLFAIGGMKPANAPEVARAGAFGCAAVSTLWHGEDPVAAVEAMSAAFE